MLNMRDDIGIWRSIKVSRLRELLAEAPDDANVIVNEVGGLSFYDGDAGKEDDWQPVGFVDIASERFVPRP